MIGIIRVVSTLSDTQLQSHAFAISHLVSDEIVTRAIPDQPSGVHDDETFAAAVPKVVAVGRQLAEEGCRVVVISCAADPGLAELRAEVDVPVVGAGSAGAALALAAGGRVGVLGITPDVPEAVSALLGDRLVAAVVPAGVSTTKDLMQPEAYERSLAAAESLKAAGAESILFACTGLTTIGLAADVAARTRLPVVDAVMAAGTVAGLIVRPVPPTTH